MKAVVGFSERHRVCGWKNVRNSKSSMAVAFMGPLLDCKYGPTSGVQRSKSWQC